MSIERLGYIGLEVSDPSAWDAYATSVLGLMRSDAPSGAPRYRADDQAWRIALEPGPRDDLAYVGFETAGPEALAALAARLEAAGVAVTAASPELLDERGVVDLFTCEDPEGLRIEAFFGPTERNHQPFRSPAGVSGFVTGDQGLGHVVLATDRIAELRRFYRDLLQFRLSDTIRLPTRAGPPMELEFYRCNPRHHTVALVPAAGPRRLHHFMLQAQTLDDVGFALDRHAAAGAVITESLGRHTNDHMVSFYARTPSGFSVEFGYGAREVDEAQWRVVRHEKTSSWGHRRPKT